jgi:hypothetical protein
MTSLPGCRSGVRAISVLLCCAVLVAPGLAPATAAADADPASDVLLEQDVFYPYTATVSASIQHTLNREVAAARRARFPIKVALIGHPYDLGGVPELFGKPRRYATFLDTEISFRTLQPVLVVMAAGLGGDGLGRPATAALAKLARPASDQANVLAQAAIADVPSLAAAAGHPIGTTAPARSVASGGGGLSATVPIGIGVAIAIVAVALALVTVRDRRRGARS